MSDAPAAASEAVSRRCHELRFRGPVSLVAALVTLKDAGLGSIPFDRIGRAPSQMRIAAAFAAADRSNKSLLLDDVRTPFHSPVRDQHPQATFNCGKRAELGRQACGYEKPVQNRCNGRRNQYLFPPSYRPKCESERCVQNLSQCAGETGKE
jgi:hypothetical protein